MNADLESDIDLTLLSIFRLTIKLLDTFLFDNHVTIMWLSCDYHVTIMWLSCDYHVTIMWQSYDYNMLQIVLGAYIAQEHWTDILEC